MKVNLSFIMSSLFALLLIVTLSQSTSKYSRELNEEVSLSNGNIDKPFRMYKLNQLWEKASKRLSGQKLKNLMTDLKDHDKQEINLKRLRTEGSDKDGMKEAAVRRNLKIILKKYGLEGDILNSENGNSVGDFKTFEKSIFRDKKLDKLWQKAMNTGFDEEQLKLLKEEFLHHQDKIDEYHRLITEHEIASIDTKKDELDNHLISFETTEKKKNITTGSMHQALEDKHFELKRNYEDLKTKVKDRTIRPKGKEFEEANVQKLWNLALAGDFTRDELESLRDELTHYQTRIKKLHFFEEQLNNERLTGKDTVNQPDDVKVSSHIERKVKELNYKVDKVHNELEKRILKRHVEL